MNFAGDYGAALTFFLVWAGKATVLVGLAWCANLLLRRQSAALRHQVWAIAIIGALALPLASLAMPAWHVISAAEPVAVSAPQDVSISIAAADIAAPPMHRHWDWGAMIPAMLAVWAIGVGIFLLRLVAGFARLGRTAAYSKAVTEDCLTALAAELRDRFSIRRMIRVLESASAATMPMTWGILRPQIVLPRGAAEWDPQRKRIVLSHELAHVSRCDWMFQISAELLRACFWFHPLAWISGNRLRQESERACDDAVLNSGLTAEKYASELLALTGVLKTDARDFSLPLAIARPSNLERRFAAMLDPSIRRNGISRKRSLLTAAFGACLLLPLAALTLSAEVPQQLPSTEAAVAAVTPVSVQQSESALPSAGHGAASPRLIHASKPASDVAAYWPAGRGRDPFLKDCSGCHAAEDVIGQNVNADGWTNVLSEMSRLGAQIPKADFAPVVDYLATNFGTKSITAIRAVSGAATPPAANSQAPPPSAATAQAAASASVAGVVKDPSGAVIPGAEVRLTQTDAATPSEAMALAVQSGSGGDFAFPGVVPATYTLSIEQAGFQPYSQKGIQLQEGEHLNLHNISLQVGPIAQEITVTASASAPDARDEAAQFQQQPCVAPGGQTTPLLPAQPGRIRVGGAVEAARIICMNMPRYPAIARTAHVQGTVMLHAIVDRDGSVMSVEFVSGPALLVNAAMQAVKQWRYAPALLDGQPVEVGAEIGVTFHVGN